MSMEPSSSKSVPSNTPLQQPSPPRKKPPLDTLPPSSFSFKDATMDLILEDLSSRFILNLPDNELASVERVCFQVEQAHWYYEDFIRPENPSLPSMVLRAFSAKLFAACPLLQRWSHRHEEAFDEFLKYKTSVPVCGGILLNSTWDKCVLVKGWKSGSPWGFPRGKINENEPLHECAAREVLEETGYPCQDQIREEVHITLLGKDHQLVSVYLIPNVPEDFPFSTRTRKEISKIEWFNLMQLPGFGFADDEDERAAHRGTSQTNKVIRTWGISPFLKQLKNRLTYFQISFGYIPPNLSPHELREYRRIQKQVVRSQHAQRGRQKDPRAQGGLQEQEQDQPSTGDAAAADSESTGAEGDEEPELDTDYDHEPANGGGGGGGGGQGASSRETRTAGPSAIDALFTKSGGASAYHADGYSSPDVTGQQPVPAATTMARRASKPHPNKARRNSRTRVPSTQTVLGGDHSVQHATTVAADTPNNERERAHFANLMNSLASSSKREDVQSPAVPLGKGVGSGLPTPAESPIVPPTLAALNQRPSGQNGVGKEGTGAAYINGSAPSSTSHHHPAPAPSSSPPHPPPSMPMFQFISPFDALVAPVVTKKPPKEQPNAKAQAQITILKRPTASASGTSQPASSESLANGSSTAHQNPRPTLGTQASAVSAVLTTSGSEDHYSRSGSENLGDVSSSADDESSGLGVGGVTDRHSTRGRDFVRSPIPEAPSTLGFAVASTGGMMTRGSSISSGQYQMPRSSSPDQAVTMTPKAKLRSIGNGNSSLGPPSHANEERRSSVASSSGASTSRSVSMMSTGSSNSAQHLALLDMVATEAEVIALSTCPTPQAGHGGIGLPPVTENVVWESMNGAGRLGTVQEVAAAATAALGGPARIEAGGLSGYVTGLPLNAYRQNAQQAFEPSSYPMSNMNLNHAAALPLSGFGTIPYPQHPHPLPPQQSYRPAPSALPPHLHHPHPLMHPHHNIHIPSASPSPHRLPHQTSQQGLYDFNNGNNGLNPNVPPPPLPPNNQMNVVPNLHHHYLHHNQHPDVLYNTSDRNHLLQPLAVPPPMAPQPPMNHVSTAGNHMMEMMHGPSSTMGGGPQYPGYPSMVPPVAAGPIPMQGRSVSGMVSSPPTTLNRLPRPLSGAGLRGPQAALGANGSRHSGEQYRNGQQQQQQQQQQPPPPVQPYLGPRAPMSPPNPGSFVVQKSQTDRAELLNFLRSPVVPDGSGASAMPKPVPRETAAVPSVAPVVAPAPKRPAVVFETGFVPANVQFRALAKAGTGSSPGKHPK